MGNRPGFYLTAGEHFDARLTLAWALHDTPATHTGEGGVFQRRIPVLISTMKIKRPSNKFHSAWRRAGRKWVCLAIVLFTVTVV